MSREIKRERLFLVFLILCLIAIIYVSKAVFGINLGLIPGSPLSVGFKETRDDYTWSVSFEQFNGKIKNSITVSNRIPDSLYLQMKAESGKLVFRIESKTLSRDFETGSSVIKIPLSEFGEGVIRLMLIGEKAGSGAVFAQWEHQPGQF